MEQTEPEADRPIFPRPRVEPADEEIVERIKAGETGLFETLMRRYNQRLYRIARAIVRDESEAEDVMQQAYVNAYAHLRQFAGRAKFSTWLTRIAVHEALARARRRARLQPLEPAPDESEDGSSVLQDARPDPEKQAQSAEVRRLLESAIDGLPERYRAVFVLRDARRGFTPRKRRSASTSARRPCARASTARGPCCGDTFTSAQGPPAGPRSPSTSPAATASWPECSPDWVLPGRRA